MLNTTNVFYYFIIPPEVEYNECVSLLRSFISSEIQKLYLISDQAQRPFFGLSINIRILLQNNYYILFNEQT